MNDLIINLFIESSEDEDKNYHGGDNLATLFIIGKWLRHRVFRDLVITVILFYYPYTYEIIM